MMNKELFEGPVGDYCIARNTIKFLLILASMLKLLLLKVVIILPGVDFLENI